jgi:anti-sigma B factor antagonist
MTAVARCPSLALVDLDDTSGPIQISIHGELDISNNGLVTGLLEMAPGGPSAVIVDLADVTFLDSSAVMALVEATEGFRSRDQELRVTAPPGHPVHRIVSILGVDVELVVSEGQQEASS